MTVRIIPVEREIVDDVSDLSWKVEEGEARGGKIVNTLLQARIHLTPEVYNAEHQQTKDKKYCIEVT